MNIRGGGWGGEDEGRGNERGEKRRINEMKIPVKSKDFRKNFKVKRKLRESRIVKNLHKERKSKCM